jgi:hypothetical protein
LVLPEALLHSIAKSIDLRKERFEQWMDVIGKTPDHFTGLNIFVQLESGGSLAER